MKRFVIDFVLILLLVMLGSSYMKEDARDIDIKIEEYEERIDEDGMYTDITLNKATELAGITSDVIEDVVGMSVELITRFFSAIIE